jgi:hypothetical protein
MHVVRRRSAIALAVLLGGCFPFFGGKGDPPRTPDAVVRFASAANALGVPPDPPPLPEVTRLLAGAVESLPAAPEERALGQKIDAEARAMRGPDQEAARRSLALALQALEKMKKPAGSTRDRQRALADVQQAANIDEGYRAVARAMLLFTGGQPEVASGGELSALVARFASEDAEAARRTGAQVVYALAAALGGLHADAGDLRQRAARLVDAAPLAYAPELRDALALAVDALAKLPQPTPAFAALRQQAQQAMQRIVRDRPFDLQRAVMQDALRLVSDAITVRARSAPPGR